jgi:hypothetical protein
MTSKRTRAAGEPPMGSTAQAVLCALQLACTEEGRTVQTGEVMHRLSDADAKTLGQNPKGLSTAVGAVLFRLVASGHAFSPGRVAFRRQWGASGVLAPTSALPEDVTPRQRVLGYVRAAISRLGRGVRLADVADQAALDPAKPALSRDLVRVSLGSLTSTGHLVVLGKVVGRRSGGTHVYVLADHPRPDATLDGIVTWPEEVCRAVLHLWEEHVCATEGTAEKPRPIYAGEVASFLATSHPGNTAEELAFRTRGTLQTLCRGANARIRKLAFDSPDRVGWVPAGVEDDQFEIDPTHAHSWDTAKAAEALARACARHARPLASNLEVRREVGRDPKLRPVGKSTLARALESASREVLTDHGGRRRPRRDRRIHRLGSSKGVAYYCLARNLAAARVHFRLFQIEEGLTRGRVEEQISTLERCTIPAIARARAAQLQSALDNAITAMNDVLSDPAVESAAEAAATLQVSQLMVLNEQLESWVGRGPVKRDPATFDAPAWTPEELFEEALPIAPYLDGKTPRDMNVVFGFTVRTLLNPEFTMRTAPDRRQSTLLLFDRAAALMHLAREYGGPECLQQAVVAANELGTYRDPLPAIEALTEGSLDERLVACACLSFLWSDEGRAALLRAALVDPEPGVRQVALWGYAFARGADALLLLADRSRSDPGDSVRVFAGAAVASVQDDPRGCWAL